MVTAARVMYHQQRPSIEGYKLWGKHRGNLAKRTTVAGAFSRSERRIHQRRRMPATIASFRGPFALRSSSLCRSRFGQASSFWPESSSDERATSENSAVFKYRATVARKRPWLFLSAGEGFLQRGDNHGSGLRLSERRVRHKIGIESIGQLSERQVRRQAGIASADPYLV